MRKKQTGMRTATRATSSTDLPDQPELGGTLFLFSDPEQNVPRPKRWWQNLSEKCCNLSSLCKKIDPEDKRKALVTKNGGYRVYAAGLSEHKRKYLADLYITLIDLEWRYALAILFNVFLVTFMVFSVFWWLMAFNNGDFDNLDNPNHEFCLLGVKSYPGAILFSIETQTTIGYGMAYPNADCAGTLPLVYLQVVLGFFLETCMLGFIFVKIARPKYRANTIVYSKHAVINHENGNLVLQIRLGDLRQSHLVDSTISGMVVRRRSTEEGAYYPLYQFNCEFSANGMGDRIFLLWPITITHIIDKDSPLYDIRPADLSSEKFEIVLFLCGTVEATGEQCQARTSYLPKEILWGHRFERIEEYDIGHSRWHVDFAGFDDVVYCQNIRHSAKELDRFKEGKVEKVTNISNPAMSDGNEGEVVAIPQVRYDLEGEAKLRMEEKGGQAETKA
ncbi:ATP-sensitive inward rectifier potassium channel 10 [Aplysia californica]|uniref:ATP-sensitive inward rectifier potassium channel 10 n=1 Tax=Aplysia californica TaxID=6500 RepID=A0ABM1AAJ8_APLCA|nr:ATP-sensitive inward rectifier potassium channel 10 [Aplysia californica]